MKIYTKTGDDGNTGLLGGIKVSKSHLAVETGGTLDELNSILGVIGSHLSNPKILAQLQQIQNDLFDLGSRVAACLGEVQRVGGFSDQKPLELESLIDHYEETLQPLTAFILPSGSVAGCNFHLARSICRRAERRLVELSESGVKRDLEVERIYLNRLSDLLFVLSRVVNREEGVAETLWKVTKND